MINSYVEDIGPESEDLLRSSLKFKVTDLVTDDPLSYTIFNLVKEGKITALSELFNSKNDEDIYKLVNIEDNLGRSPIFYAAYFDYRNLVLYLQIKGADPTLFDVEGNSVFHLCCDLGHYQSLLMIMNFFYFLERENLDKNLKALQMNYNMKRSDVNFGKLTSPDAHLLHVSNNFKGFDQSAKDLYLRYLDKQVAIHNMICVDYIDPYGRSPIHYGAMAKYFNCARCVRMCVLVGELQFYDQFELNFNEIQLQEINKSKKIELKKTYAVVGRLEKFLDKGFIMVATNDHTKKVARMHRECLNRQDQQGYTPLHLASFHGNYELTDLFLRLGNFFWGS